MHCTLEELGERMSGEEFALWEAFLVEEPQGGLATITQTAQLRASIANGTLKPRGGKTSLSPSDFFPELWKAEPVTDERTPREPTLEEIRRFAEGGAR